LIGGIAGGTVSLIGCYTWYYVSGAKSFMDTAHETKQYFQTAQKRFIDKAPQPNEASRWLRQVSMHYAGFIPGATEVVETALNDLDTIHDKHRDEVDRIIQDIYNDLKQVSTQGMTIAAAGKAWEVLQKHMERLGQLTSDATGDMLQNHPELKEKVGGNLDQLKQMGEQYGPEAKKQVDETWEQIKDIMKQDSNSDMVENIHKLVQKNVARVQKLGDEAFQKALEKSKPYLDKNPQVKDLVEENAGALKQGNFEQLYEKVKSATESGNMEDLEKFVKDAANKVKKGNAGGFDQILKNILGSNQVLPDLQSLQEIAEKYGGEAKTLLDETIQEVSEILSKKADQAKELAKERAKDAEKPRS
jgi:hypothetical protein